MEYTKQIAKLLRDVHFGGNWTWVNLKENLADVSFEHATQKVENFNTIAALVYHLNYYTEGVTEFLKGKPLTIKDQFSWEMPVLNSQKDWQNLLDKTWADAENLAQAIENLPEKKLDEIFFEDQYGNYYRNLHGIIEHCHYHLGQIVLIKKILNQK